MASSLPRITARITPEIADLLKEASALSGINSINSFVLSSAIEKAKAILREHETVRLSRKESISFFEAIEKEPQIFSKLTSAYKSYKDNE